ncbi:hypothetical protein Q8F55_002531 [Vanrija albida]|uniref:Peroxin domain-containing protein n=1 Tax=Vanrija albida TaxID=181172 RepID=A0ABR3QA84_9TREE
MATLAPTGPPRSTASASSSIHFSSASRPRTPSGRPQSGTVTPATGDGGESSSLSGIPASERPGSPSEEAPVASSSSSASPPPPPAVSTPIISTPTADQESAINATLAGRRRRRPLLEAVSSSLHSHTPQNEDDLTFDTAAMHEAVQADAHFARCAAMDQHVELLMDGRPIHTEAELGDLGDEPVKAREYVWESEFGRCTALTGAMYENQRGVYFLGRSSYSSRTLLPSDPSGFTLPTYLAGGHGKNKRKTIKTGYDLETYQTPTPAWVWLTPWMVNMRSDTDEQGWRYNLWFQKKGWRQHSGRLNWWGWVRRREWVRLRALIPSAGDDLDDDTYAVPVEEPPDMLSTLMAGKDPAIEIVRKLVTYPLDRERLSVWTKWLDSASDETKKEFAGLIKDQDTLARICLAFVFPVSRDAFLVTLVTRGLASDQQCSKCTGVKEQWKSPTLGDQDGLGSGR